MIPKKKGRPPRSRYCLFLAWFLFSLSGEEGKLEGARLISIYPFRTARECVSVALVMQANRLTPFYFCVGSEEVAELPPLSEWPLIAPSSPCPSKSGGQ